MKLEEQVCSLELAKKLKELGVKQESLFYWFNNWNGYAEGHPSKKENWILLDRYKDTGYPAFTVAELGETLPKTYYSGKSEKGILKYQCGSDDESRNKRHGWTRADTEADARAKMLIYLIENGLIKL